MSFLTKELSLPKLKRGRSSAPERDRAEPLFDQPMADQTVSELPAARLSVADAPVADAPVAEARVAETPVSDASKAGRRKVDRRKTERRKADRRGTTGIVGLELGATQIVAARASVRDARLVADQLVVRAIPEGLVRDGLVVDAKGLASELRAMFAEHKLPKKVRVGLATPRTILRVIDLPPLDEKDIKLALPLQAQERIPMPLESAVLDHQTVGLVDTPEGQRLRVIVVATEREGVNQLVETLRAAGLRTEGIDLSVFAVIRALSSGEPTAEPVLYAQLGDLVNIAITKHGICHFTRQAPQGLSHVLEQIVERRGVTPAEAQQLLWAAAGDGPEPASRADAAEIGGLLSRVATEIGSELRAAAEFYGTQQGAVVSRGVVTGSLAPLRGFVETLAEASGLELTCGEVRTVDDGISAALDPRVAPVAVGLTTDRTPA